MALCEGCEGRCAHTRAGDCGRVRLEKRVAYLEDELSECELCDRSLLVSEAESAAMDAEDPDTARPAGAAKMIVCGDCWARAQARIEALDAEVASLEAAADEQKRLWVLRARALHARIAELEAK